VTFNFQKGGFTVENHRYNIEKSQVGAVGTGAHARDMTFEQVWTEAKHDIDLEALARELTQLRSAMRQEATAPEHDVAIGEVAAAEAAATEGDGSKALQHLRNAGKWAWNVATQIGVSTASAALKISLGL
jgi:hypothetical protein